MSEARESKMFQAKWIAFQFVVAGLTFYWISTWADVTQFGIAPGVVSMFVAFIATGLLVRFLDWRALRRIAVSDELQREHSRLVGIGRSAGDGPKQIDRVRVSDDTRKLT